MPSLTNISFVLAGSTSTFDTEKASRAEKVASEVPGTVTSGFGFVVESTLSGTEVKSLCLARLFLPA